MEQNYNRSNGMAYQPPVVSGSEPRRQRTGVAYRTTNSPMYRQQNMHQPQRNTITRQTRDANMRSEQTPEMSKDCTGILPCDAPLANPYVPFQRTNPPRYSSQRGLARGTLYPGLDLPLMGMVNSDKPKTLQTELMALQFAVTELGLYLDMHPEDTDALEVFRDYAARAAEAKEAYEQRFGPLMQRNAGENGCWDWICDPWPWEFCQEG